LPTEQVRKWNSPDQFVAVLREAIQEEAATIRETDLDSVGYSQDVALYFSYGEEPKVTAFIDRLDRVHIPVNAGDAEVLESIALVSDHKGVGTRRAVIRVEPRFEGDNHTTWVCYLED